MALKALVQQAEKSPFPVVHLPFGVASIAAGAKFPATRIGDYVINLQLLEELGVFSKIFGDR
jgi:hypothetical protein